MSAKKFARASLLLALGILLPSLFHLIGGEFGKVLLPMHIPVLMAGLMLDPWSALLIGVLSPLLSNFITGMPAYPIFIFKIFELAAYGFFISIFNKKFKLNTVLSLIFGIIIGQVVNFTMINAIVYFRSLEIVPLKFFLASVTAGIPGLILQLIFIPLIIYSLEKSDLLND